MIKHTFSHFYEKTKQAEYKHYLCVGRWETRDRQTIPVLKQVLSDLPNPQPESLHQEDNCMQLRRFLTQI
jgi:hypothetical protein